MARKQDHRRDGVYERPDAPGYWGSWIDANGKRVRRNLQKETLGEAKDELASKRNLAKEQRRTGVSPVTEDSFSSFAIVFGEYQRRRIAPQPAKKKVSQAEYVRQQGIITQHLVPFFGTMKLAQIRPKHVNDYIDLRLGKVSDGTIIKEVNVLKRLFSIAVSKEKIHANPAHGADIPEAPKGRVRYLSAVELKRAMTACPAWLQPIVGLAVSTGMRRGELLKIRWEDVDLPGNRILLKHTKNGRERYVYLNDLSLGVIASLNPPGQKKGSVLFPDVTPAQVTVAFVRACKAAEISDFSLHDLRHQYASLLRMNGVDLHTLQKLLGHSDPRMTDRYAHLSETFLGEAARKLDGVLSLETGSEHER